MKTLTYILKSKFLVIACWDPTTVTGLLIVEMTKKKRGNLKRNGNCVIKYNKC